MTITIPCSASSYYTFATRISCKLHYCQHPPLLLYTANTNITLGSDIPHPRLAFHTVTEHSFHIAHFNNPEELTPCITHFNKPAELISCIYSLQQRDRSFHALPTSETEQSSLHALPTAMIQNPHPSSTVLSTTQNVNIVLAGHSSRRFITVPILHTTHCHDSFAILRTLSILKTHNFHFTHYLHPVSTILTLHTLSTTLHLPISQLLAVLLFHALPSDTIHNSQVPFAVYIPHIVRQF
ncbi:hypothetical protein AVEN_247385-1 [Araneus ventricosus]|uniref:Uncharacterized protein n=1 Tax=Araneus ventricosus TaxID=182803 RepID=A0A4Y2MQZ7_ARAVE|nr:hypothetical protein AVEN_247385-1 [Araneus ventricosus]